jgi:uncharacterized caspase-like protein
MGNILRQTATGRRATMRLLLHLAAAILLLSASAAGAADYPSEEPRLALVIGNGAYPVDPLKNAVQDAQALAATLTALGFSVTQLQNAGYREMLDALRNFGQNMQRQRGTALFYFSGHGLQLEGENYLLPIDSDIRRAHEIKYSALHVAQVLDEMEYANNRVNIVVLDASRNSSFAGEYRSVSRGLAQVDAPGGTLIALSTAPGNVSDDSEEHSGLYTKQLIANLSTPGLPVEQIFKRVRVDVMRASGGAQVPWENSSLVGDFYFSPPRDGLSATTAPGAYLPSPAATLAPSVAPPPASNSKAVELAAWSNIKHSENPADYEAYLEHYPQGQFQALANFRLRKYRRQNNPRASAAPSQATPPPPPPAVATAPQAAPSYTADWVAPAYTPPPPVATSAPQPTFDMPTPTQELLQKAHAAFAANRLTTPANDSALKWSRDLLALDPGNLEARAIIRQVIDKYLGWSAVNLRRDNTDKARRYLDKATRLSGYASLQQQDKMHAIEAQITAARTADSAPEPEPETTAPVAEAAPSEPEEEEGPSSIFEAIAEDLSKINLETIQKDLTRQHEKSGFRLHDYE